MTASSRYEIIDAGGRYAAVVAAAGDAIMLADFESGRFFDVNPAACRMFGYERKELVTMVGRMLHPPEERDRVDAFSAQLHRDYAARGTFRCVRKDGTQFWGEVSATVQLTSSCPFLVALVRDVSDRVAADAARQQAQLEAVRSEEQLRAVFESAADAILVADFDTALFTLANPAARKLFGYTTEEFLLLNGRKLHPPFVSEEVDRISAAIRETGHASSSRIPMVRKDGTVFWADLHLDVYSVGGVKQYVCILRDVSDHVAREQELAESMRALEQTQAMLASAGRLSALGQLAAGIAHEFNQPLTAIQGFAERIRAAGGLPGFQEELDVIMRESRRLAALVDDVRTFGRVTPLERQPIDPIVPFDDALRLVGKLLEKNGIELRRAINEPVPQVLGDRAKLQQVYLNLLLNACDAMAQAAPEGRRIVLTASVRRDSVEVALENNGPPVPEEVRERLFDPFFTTKGPRAGTGLGLSIAYAILQDHGGEIRHEPVSGGGARFLLVLPAHREP